MCKLYFQGCGRVNYSIKKDVNKVVDSVDVEDITEKAVFCRCWKSENVSLTISYFYDVPNIMILN